MRGAMGSNLGVGALAVLLTSLSACAASGGGTAGERPRGVERATVPKALPGDPELGSEPEVESLLRLTRNRMGPLQACYEVGLRKTPTMAGRVVLRFAIRPDGLLEEVQVVEDQLEGYGVADCVRSRVAAWRTPFRPKDRVTVEYPFDFTPIH